MKYAFYDFSVAPYSFDFATFLVAAKANECDHLVFVPGHREYQKLNKMQQELRFLHLMLPLLYGQTQISDFTICKDRDEAKALWTANCYPNGYTVDSPIEGHLLRHVTQNPRLVPFKAVEDGIKYVDEKLNGRKPIVITIRQTMRPLRNSNIDAWIEFANDAKSQGFDVVFVPDTDNLEQDFGFESWPAAAAHIDIRMALYERALVNMGVGNGPMMLPFLSGLPLLMLKPIVEEHVESSARYWLSQNIAPGSQPSWFNKAQRIIWQDDSAKHIKEAFNQWLDVQAGGTWGKTPIPHIALVAAGNDDLRESQMAAALATGWPRLKPADKVRDDTLSIVCYGPSLVDTWQEIEGHGPILTVSGAHDFLIERGIVPTYHLDSDPRAHKAKFTANPHKDVHYLMASCCSPKIWEQLKGHNVTLWHILNSHSNARWVLKNDPDSPLFGCGSTAGLAAIEIAGAGLGFNKFRIFGMDSSSRDDGETLHAGAHNGKAQKRMTVTAGDNTYITTPQLIEAARGFLRYVSERPIKSLKLYGDGLLQEMYYQSSKLLIEQMNFLHSQPLEDSKNGTSSRI